MAKQSNGAMKPQPRLSLSLPVALNPNELVAFSLTAWCCCWARGWHVQYVLQLELLHDSKGAADNEHCFRHFASHLGMDGHVRGGGVSHTGLVVCTSLRGNAIRSDLRGIRWPAWAQMDKIRVGRVREGKPSQ